MEKLKEGYKLVNPNATIEIQQSDSTTGINSAIEKIADIAMVSREFKASELKSDLKTQILALDGLAVIVNKENSIDSLSKESVKSNEKNNSLITYFSHSIFGLYISKRC